MATAGSLAALVRPGEAWAPWAAFSDLSANVEQVCKNGIYVHIAEVAGPLTPEERAALPRTRGASLQVASPAPAYDVDTEQYVVPPDPDDVVTNRDLRLLKGKITYFLEDDPNLEQTKEYNRRFLATSRKLLSPGAEVAISFDRFGNPEAHREPPPQPVADCMVTATQYNDVLIGSSRSERLDALRGNDQVFAAGGRDRVFGRKGHDKLYGGPGRDVMYGGPGNDRIDGGKKGDRLYGNGGRDRLYGKSGSDRLVARGGGRDYVNCGSGFDWAIVDFRDRVSSSCEVIRRG